MSGGGAFPPFRAKPWRSLTMIWRYFLMIGESLAFFAVTARNSEPSANHQPQA
jgi:hypothetical protein